MQEARAEEPVHVGASRQRIVDADIEVLDRGRANAHRARPRQRHRDPLPADDIAAHPRRAVRDLEPRAPRELRLDQRLARSRVEHERAADAVDPYGHEERGIRLPNRDRGRRGAIRQLPRADEREVLALDRVLRAALEAVDVGMLRRPRVDLAVIVDAT